MVVIFNFSSQFRDKIDSDNITVQLPGDCATLEEIIKSAIEQFPDIKDVMEDVTGKKQTAIFIVDKQFIKLNDTVDADSIIKVFLPTCGG
jgi:hypothetical protein